MNLRVIEQYRKKELKNGITDNDIIYVSDKELYRLKQDPRWNQNAMNAFIKDKTDDKYELAIGLWDGGIIKVDNQKAKNREFSILTTYDIEDFARICRSKFYLNGQVLQPYKKFIKTVNGKEYIELFLTVDEAYELKDDWRWQATQQGVSITGEVDEIFKHAIGIWDMVILKVDENKAFNFKKNFKNFMENL